MDRLSICRICLSADSRLYSIIDTPLQAMFESLTLVPLVQKDHRPVQVCPVCCTQLENYYQLRRRCLRSQELFTQLLSSQVQVRLTRVKSDPDVGAELRENYHLLCDDEVKQEEIEEDIADCPAPGDVYSDPHRVGADAAGEDFSPVVVKVESVAVDVSNPEREYEGQDVIVGPSPCATHAVEEVCAHRNLTTANTTRDNNKDNIEISANKISSTCSIGVICGICQKRFSTKSQYKIHERTHTGEKPYKCSVCMKCFSQKGNLVKHNLTHTGEKPYKCSDCTKCFSQECSLLMHIRLHTGEKPYKCSDCMKCFSYKVSLNRHIFSHTGEKPFKCSDCMKCFRRKCSLKMHSCTLSGVKTYKCSKCMMWFSNKKHVCQVTGEKPYHCNDCMECFSLKSSLKVHIRTCTREKPYHMSDRRPTGAHRTYAAARRLLPDSI